MANTPPQEEKKKKKQENVVQVKNATTTTKETGNLTEAELKKIEKKKAKKLAQKLKKAQKKAAAGISEGTKVEKKKEENKGEEGQGKASKKAKKRKLEVSEQEQQSAEQVPNKKNKKKNNKLAKEDANKEEVAETEKKVVATKETTEASERVQLKKEKKLKKREELKAQKLAEKKPRDPAEEEATVFVGNLPVNTKRVQLTKLFKKYGPVNSIRLRTAAGQILHKHKMRKAAGALNAYVVLTSKEAAEKALELNGSEFKGMHLRVTKSSLKHSASALESKEEAKRTIFVGNLKYTATEESLRETFSSCGEIEYVRCIRDKDKGCKGVAYVRFKTADAVGLALELNQTLLDDRPINVERYSVKKLGAKEQRDVQAAKEKLYQKHNKKAVGAGGDKSKKFNKNKNSNSQPKQSQGGDGEKKTKKSEFRGVKVEALKKKQQKQKKKKPSQAMDIAKKIAPRPKSDE
ncbi:RNA-binding protein 34-like [Musca vetustissima]|uniref:RNA-binding protein 34-like n=1 Tax=Musca vetustissima TaxID=27455 RepID=UPI002AB6F19B|nr:RNA-binding protein 34-like [Musca vetustissima]